jgi:hypothetical protein
VVLNELPVISATFLGGELQRLFENIGSDILAAEVRLQVKGKTPASATDVDERVLRLQSEGKQRAALQDAYLIILTTDHQLHGSFTSVVFD